MTTKQILAKFREGAIWIVLGAIVSIVPFYYNTNASIGAIENKAEIHDSEINEVKTEFSNIKGLQSVQEERHINIQRRLERIEKKLDYLIEQGL